MKVVAFVFARSGSVGIPHKNLQEVGGVSLLERSIKAARSLDCVEKVIVSTDDPAISEKGKRAGAEVPFLRPDYLASATADEWDAWRHAIAHETTGAFDVFLSVSPTAPLRISKDLQECLDRFSRGDVDMVVTGSPSSRSPHFNMVRKLTDGTVELCQPLSREVTRRQDAPKTFDLTTVAYVTTPQFVLKHHSIFSGKVGLVQVPRARAWDVDEPMDLEIARFLCEKPYLLSGKAVQEF